MAITIGDPGYRGKSQDLLIEEAEILMLTRADAAERKKLLSLSQIRQQIETTFSVVSQMENPLLGISNRLSDILELPVGRKITFQFFPKLIHWVELRAMFWQPDEKELFCKELVATDLGILKCSCERHIKKI